MRYQLKHSMRYKKEFPNSMELDRYANTRIEVLVGDFVNQLGSEREEYEQYLDRRSQSIADARFNSMSCYNLNWTSFSISEVIPYF